MNSVAVADTVPTDSTDSADTIERAMAGYKYRVRYAFELLLRGAISYGDIYIVCKGGSRPGVLAPREGSWAGPKGGSEVFVEMYIVYCV